ncbi:hypothetical protein Micbo1qcDRAFT_155573 [Microdochium bolleyi]|uniref:Chromosome transmission fidelity protein 4 n=1 Tax=Microdochium bolleyi TaxID=196109 RepID=A0A136JIB0_9PEZI|nr:hypothetical protein Micbo1qcDRAFT_155573 [Microdochium bolleyi]
MAFPSRRLHPALGSALDCSLATGAAAARRTSATGMKSLTIARAISGGVPKRLNTAPIIPRSDTAPIWFDSSAPSLDTTHNGSGPSRPDDERKVKLGKTLRILQERLPTLLQSPLPQEILAPNISLHLFPTTHPYLPTVSGRVGYIAALWTSPIAWNRFPIVGNVKLDILSERVTSNSVHSSRRTGSYPEQLVVRWRTSTNKSKSSGSSVAVEDGEHNYDGHVRGTQNPGEKKAFTGLFIFEFDKDGKILSHTIEHADESGEWENGVGAKVVGLTDWLLGGIKGHRDGEAGPVPLFESAHRKGPGERR